MGNRYLAAVTHFSIHHFAGLLEQLSVSGQSEQLLQSESFFLRCIIRYIINTSADNNISPTIIHCTVSFISWRFD